MKVAVWKTMFIDFWYMFIRSSDISQDSGVWNTTATHASCESAHNRPRMAFYGSISHQ